MDRPAAARTAPVTSLLEQQQRAFDSTQRRGGQLQEPRVQIVGIAAIRFDDAAAFALVTDRHHPTLPLIVQIPPPLLEQRPQRIISPLPGSGHRDLLRVQVSVGVSAGNLYAEAARVAV